MKPSEIHGQRIEEPTWIVRDMIPQGTLVVWAGEAGAGKSTACLTLAYAVACGVPFLGFQTVPTRVLYFDEENGQPDFLKYHEWVYNGLGRPGFELLDRNLDVRREEFVKGWKFAMATAVRDHKPGLVIVDTANSAFHIKDENDNAEAANIILDLKRIRRENASSETSFIVLKHERQRDDTTHRRTIRGAKVWLGAFDQTLYHVIAPGAKRRKDGTRKTILEPDKLRAFALRHRVGIDPRLEDNSLILNTYIPSDGPETP